MPADGRACNRPGCLTDRGARSRNLGALLSDSPPIRLDVVALRIEDKRREAIGPTKSRRAVVGSAGRKPSLVKCSDGCFIGRDKREVEIGGEALRLVSRASSDPKKSASSRYHE